jgi:HlyD family secretion protein
VLPVKLEYDRDLLAGTGGWTVVAGPIVERDVPVSARLVGTVIADRMAVVASEVSGLIQDFGTREGEFLKAGTVICRIDAAVAQLRLDEAQGRLASLTAMHEELTRGTRPEELRRWEAMAAEAQAMHDKWAYEKRRIADLSKSGQSNEKEAHDTEMEYLAAERRLAQVKAQLEEATNGPRAEEIARAKFGAAAQAAVVSKLQRDVAKCEIIAPFDGFVVQKRTEIGEWIVEGGPVCEMVAIETVRIRADAPESAVPFARTGAPATVEIEALGRTMSGTVARVIPRAAMQARTFPVEIDVPNADHTLLPGMFVWVHVPAGAPGKRLMVNRDAVVSSGPAKTIFVIRPGPGGVQMAMPTPVTTGLELGGEVEVQAVGLQAGELVVTRANERLYGPSPVIVMPASNPEPTSQPAAARGGR